TKIENQPRRRVKSVAAPKKTFVVMPYETPQEGVPAAASDRQRSSSSGQPPRDQLVKSWQPGSSRASEMETIPDESISTLLTRDGNHGDGDAGMDTVVMGPKELNMSLEKFKDYY